MPTQAEKDRSQTITVRYLKIVQTLMENNKHFWNISKTLHNMNKPNAERDLRAALKTAGLDGNFDNNQKIIDNLVNLAIHETPYSRWVALQTGPQGEPCW